MLAQAFNAFFNHIGFWICNILAVQFIVLGPLILGSMFNVYCSSLFNFLFDLSGLYNNAWQPILNWLQPYLPKYSYEGPEDLTLLLSIYLFSMSLNFSAVFWQYAASFAEYGKISGHSFKKVGQNTTVYYYVKTFRAVGMLVLILVMRNIIPHIVPGNHDAFWYIWNFGFAIPFYYAYYRFWFVMPQIFSGNSLVPSIKSSWIATKQLGLEGVAAFIVLISIRLSLLNALDYLPFHHDYMSLVRLIYDNLVLVFLMLIDFAAWYQVRDSKEVILEHTNQEAVIS